MAFEFDPTQPYEELAVTTSANGFSLSDTPPVEKPKSLAQRAANFLGDTAVAVGIGAKQGLEEEGHFANTTSTGTAVSLANFLPENMRGRVRQNLGEEQLEDDARLEASTEYNESVTPKGFEGVRDVSSFFLRPSNFILGGGGGFTQSGVRGAGDAVLASGLTGAGKVAGKAGAVLEKVGTPIANIVDSINSGPLSAAKILGKAVLSPFPNAVVQAPKTAAQVGEGLQKLAGVVPNYNEAFSFLQRGAAPIRDTLSKIAAMSGNATATYVPVASSTDPKAPISYVPVATPSDNSQTQDYIKFDPNQPYEEIK